MHVVTKVPPDEEAGNLAVALPLLEVEPMDKRNDWKGRYVPAAKLLGGTALSLRMPVFKLGEVLLLDADGRDQFGRNPSKWDVELTECPTLGDVERVLADLLRRTSRIIMNETT